MRHADLEFRAARGISTHCDLADRIIRRRFHKVATARAVNFKYGYENAGTDCGLGEANDRIELEC